MDHFCAPPKTWTGGLAAFSPLHSSQWNTVSLVLSDLDERYLYTMRCLRDKLLSGDVSAADVDSVALTFSIPCSQGTYDLIPNGKDIRVDASNLSEYVSRLEMEYDKWSSALSTPPRGGSGDSRLNYRNYNGMQTNVNANNNNNNNNNDNIKAGLPSASVLTASDLHFLQAFAANASSMAETAVQNPSVLKALGLRWSIEVPGKNVPLPLCPKGDDTLVKPEDYAQYVQAVIDCVSAVRHTIAVYQQYPAPSSQSLVLGSSLSAAKNTGSSANQGNNNNNNTNNTNNGLSNTPEQQRNSNNNIYNSNSSPTSGSIYSSTPLKLREEVEAARSAYMRELAVPLTTTAAERALFSPTHESYGIFAPPQHINW